MNVIHHMKIALPFMTQLELLSPGCTRLVRKIYGLFPETYKVKIVPLKTTPKILSNTRNGANHLLRSSMDFASLPRGCAVMVMMSQGFPAKVLHRVKRR